jgi:lysine-N-methylase
MAPFSTDEARGLRSPVIAPTHVPPGPADLPQVTTDAVEAFSCVAEKCEDTCCRDWAVPLDRASLDQLKTTLSRSPEGRERLVRLVVIGRPTQQARGAVQIQMDENNACPLLESDNRCGVHASFGEAALSTACSVFPRTALAVDGQLEIGASLGCPEVSRQVLLSERTLQLRPANKPMLARSYVGKTINSDPADAYAHHFPQVRAVLQRLFRRSELPLSTRLVAAANFADRIQSFFFAGTDAFAGAKGSFTTRRLEAEISEAESLPVLTALDRDLAAFDANAGQATAGLVGTMLLERLRVPHSARFASLLKACFGSIQAELRAGQAALRADATANDNDHHLDVEAGLTPAQTWQVLRRRGAEVEQRLGARSAQIFSNYCDHFLLRHPYTDSESVLEYLHRLGLHVAAVRFLTLASPALARCLGRAAQAEDLAADVAAFDGAAVHAVQTFTKAITHHLDFLDVSYRAVAGSGGFGFGRLVMLAKFI